ncbi:MULTISPECIES: hypothetical protein [unclassified Crossiella]|uniref:hypothetical protein n=1 Tax=unclassified Crossiella TaxID=2620835 RepID=UPI001FFF7ABE|nr:MULTISPECIES: hypothetical protein [unclassified Crossiella]MCK2245224.1 hypothetical protein [Crossiella sp. S99.2]MCK2258854.1 hypothetical protein [Crossiella sp. S99.1]
MAGSLPLPIQSHSQAPGNAEHTAVPDTEWCREQLDRSLLRYRRALRTGAPTCLLTALILLGFGTRIHREVHKTVGGLMAVTGLVVIAIWLGWWWLRWMVLSTDRSMYRLSVAANEAVAWSGLEPRHLRQGLMYTRERGGVYQFYGPLPDHALHAESSSTQDG